MSNAAKPPGLNSNASKALVASEERNRGLTRQLFKKAVRLRPRTAFLLALLRPVSEGTLGGLLAGSLTASFTRGAIQVRKHQVRGGRILSEERMLKLVGTGLAVTLFWSVNAQAQVSKRQVATRFQCGEACHGLSLVRLCIRPGTTRGQPVVMTTELIRLWDSRCAGVR